MGIKIVLIGAGNLAINLGLALHEAGHEIVQVYSRTVRSAKEAAKLLRTVSTNKLKKLADADLYIVALKDSVLQDVIPALCEGRKDKLFVHTSGCLPMDIFKDYAYNYGVLYPLQTFSKEKRVDFSHIPCLVEGCNRWATNLLKALCRSISDDVRPITSEDRRYIHLAAVFCSNFSNLCYSMANEVLQQRHLRFNMLLPLIDETAAKVHVLPPRQAQTGPAVRFDENVMDMHLDLLDENTDFQEIYLKMSEQIQRLLPD